MINGIACNILASSEDEGCVYTVSWERLLVSCNIWDGYKAGVKSSSEVFVVPSSSEVRLVICRLRSD